MSFNIRVFLLAVSTLIYSTQCLTDNEIATFNTLRFPDKTEANTGKKTQLSAVDNNDGTITIKTNGIPNHATGTFPDATTNPNSIQELNVELKVDKKPKMRAAETEFECLPMGMIGISVSGEVIYSPYAAESGCPTAEEFEVLDLCEGHPSPDGTYHVHHYSPCHQMQTCEEPSGIMGVAIDGIPIYGPWDENGKQLTRQDLDDCGGKTDSKGNYRYHLTVDPPYFLGCFKAEIRKDAGVNADLFFCNCPFTDEPFLSNTRPNPPPPPPARKKRQFSTNDPSCDFNAAGDYAVCSKKLNNSYIMTKKWVEETKTINLAPCCPKGKSCGDSCIEVNSAGNKVLKSDCTREQRAVKYIVRQDKTSEEIEKERNSSSGLVQGAYLVCLALGFHLLQ